MKHRTPRCGICGCTRLHTDEVAHRGRLLLAECERCRHRWTQTLPASSAGGGARRLLAARRGRPGVAAAA